MTKKNILIMAGGTGGHIFPALAIAEHLVKKGFHIEWLGTQRGLEASLVPEHNYAINYIDIAGLRGKGLKSLLVLPFKLLRSMWQTIRIYRQIKPDVVLGLGGFVTGPGGVVAWLMAKPIILHEQNAIAGLTNKLLFHLAKKVFVAFPKAFKEHNKLALVGNPVREEIVKIGEPNSRLLKKWHDSLIAQLNILVIGGSLGAVALNDKVPQALELIIKDKSLENSDFGQINIRHQCGKKHFDTTKKNYTELVKNKEKIIVELSPFISNMAEQYQWADIIICRSGALTISEISAVGLASILVPYPYAVDDHQTANAAYLVDEKAAFLIQQNDLSSKALADLLMTLNRDILLSMAVKARNLSINNAAEIVANECVKLAG